MARSYQGRAALLRFATLFSLSLSILASSTPSTSNSACNHELAARAELGSSASGSTTRFRHERRARGHSKRSRLTAGIAGGEGHKKEKGAAAKNATVQAAPVNTQKAEGKRLGSFEWGDVDFLFSFGDSYSTTGWTPEDGVFSEDIQETTSNGPNWVNYLTSTYNSSSFYLRNLARSGATIADELVKISDHEHPVKKQVEMFTELMQPQTGLEWTDGNSLITMWVGVNDVGLSYDWENQTSWHSREMETWYELQEQLYAAGARNFLHLTAPPTYRVPLFQHIGFPTTEWVQEALRDYNVQLVENLVKFQESHDDAVVMLFDAHTEFGELLDNAESLGFKNVTHSCWAYQRGTDTPDFLNAEACVNPVNEYFWIDDYHPGTPVHKLLAEKIWKFLLDPVRVTDRT